MQSVLSYIPGHHDYDAFRACVCRVAYSEASLPACMYIYRDIYTHILVTHIYYVQRIICMQACSGIVPCQQALLMPLHGLLPAKMWLVHQAAGCVSAISSLIGKAQMSSATCHQTTSSMCDCSGGAPAACAQFRVCLPQFHPAGGETPGDHQSRRHPAHL